MSKKIVLPQLHLSSRRSINTQCGLLTKGLPPGYRPHQWRGPGLRDHL